MSDTTFKAEYAKTNRSNCKKCKGTITKGELRIAKLTPSPFSEGDSMAQWHHPACLFQAFQKVRATTKIIEEPDDLDGYGDLEDGDKKALLKLIESIQVFLISSVFILDLSVFVVCRIGSKQEKPRKLNLQQKLLLPWLRNHLTNLLSVRVSFLSNS